VTVAVEYLDDEPNGLAEMIGGLLEGNLRTHPDRARLLRPGTVGISATDADTAITVWLSPKRVRIGNGLRGRPQVVISTDSSTLTELSSTPLRLGFPDAMTDEGREVTSKLVRGDIKVRGLIRHPELVSRVNRLLSVL
jgi:hypothetical protein